MRVYAVHVMMSDDERFNGILTHFNEFEEKFANLDEFL